MKKYELLLVGGLRHGDIVIIHGELPGEFYAKHPDISNVHIRYLLKRNRASDMMYFEYSPCE